mgnify:FL=1
MGFQDAVRTCLGNYATFSGRAPRAEFWWFAVFVLLGNLLFGVLDGRRSRCCTTTSCPSTAISNCRDMSLAAWQAA